MLRNKLKQLRTLAGWRRLLHLEYTRIYVALRKPVKVIQNRKRGASLELSHVTISSAGNAGDTALSTAVRDIFEKNLGPVSWQLLSVIDEVTDRTICKLNRTDAIVIGGHGLFLPDTNANDISNWEFACSEAQYDEITRPIIVYAVGYNYFRGQERTALFESNVKKLVEKSAFFGLRNRGSVRQIQSFLPEELREKVVYQPCPTMVARYLYPDLPPKTQTRRIALNVALDRAKMRMGENTEFILDQIARAMYHLSQRGYRVSFITHMCREIPFLEYLKRYPFSFDFVDASTWDIGRLTRFYNRMDVVIGMRGHGIWIPFGVNCQIISLGNQNKTKWFLEDIDAMDWFIDINESPETLCQTIEDRFTEIHEIHGELTDKRLHEAQDRLWKITCENMQRIRQSVFGVENTGKAYPGG